MKALEIVFIAFAVIGLLLALTGLHNIDNAWNIRNVNDATGYKFVDSNGFIQAIDIYNLYNIGIAFTLLGIAMSSIGFYLLGRSR